MIARGALAIFACGAVGAAGAAGAVERPQLSVTPASGLTAGGTRVTVAWTIEMMQPGMRLAARFAPRLLRWGHDRVVANTVNGLRRHLADEPS